MRAFSGAKKLSSASSNVKNGGRARADTGMGSTMTPEQLMAQYGARLEEQDAARVSDLLSSEAVFWFNDGSFEGVEAIVEAMNRTWETIRDERYWIENLRWISKGPSSAVCIYEFHWKGLIDGQEQEGWGRGTNVLNKISGSWKIVHEHLSTPR